MTARKPETLKLISGTTKPCRARESIDIPVISDVPEPPYWLINEHAVTEWRKLATILTNNGLLTEAGLAPLAMLCALHGTLVDVWSKGYLPNGHTLAQYRNLINDFGLTPMSQSKVKTPSEKPKANAFARNGQKKA